VGALEVGLDWFKSIILMVLSRSEAEPIVVYSRGVSLQTVNVVLCDFLQDRIVKGLDVILDGVRPEVLSVKVAFLVEYAKRSFMNGRINLFW
jgi:hypothetical protein